MRLCFGTFAHVLQLCKLKTVSDPILVGTMTRTIDPDCQYINRDNATAVSRLLKCTGNLSSGNIENYGIGVTKKPGESLSRVLQLAPTADTSQIRQVFSEMVVSLLSVDMHMQIVLALLDIVEQDTTLDDGSANGKKLSFEKYVGTTKNDLLMQSEYDLSDLLAVLFHYTVAAGVTNTIGRECVKSITLDYINSLKNARNIEVKTHRLSVSGNCHLKVTTEDEILRNDYFMPYIESVRLKYNSIKTFLYKNEPKPFYEFYVCNDVERRTIIPGRYGNSYRFENIHNATATSLTENSKFIILSGTGGLGKSMMMRHLLLNTVDNFETLRLIPVFIPLKDFDESITSLFDCVVSIVKKLYGKATEGQLDSLLAQGKCLLLFDGLDEIGSTYAKHFERDLEAFTDKYPNNNYIISSRPYQSFISYSRFTVLQLMPFTKEQALRLVDNLDFRPDEPIIKDKFRIALDRTLYNTHQAFTQNPLLLTIMLMTFEQYAEVPSKMHLFYKEAYSALASRHDANKGAFKRILKTGLSEERFGEYFAEICSRSYHDEKFEMTEDEFSHYYTTLRERARNRDSTTTAGDYLYDLCSNMCLMYFENGKYHFTHRSFQEYFCAVYFAKQKDKTLERIGDFFENRHTRMYGDKTFNMLYDMIPEKIEEYVFLPFLTRLCAECDAGIGYWTFLQKLYPTLNYEIGDTNDFVFNEAESYIYSFIKHLHWPGSIDCNDFPHDSSLITTEYAYVVDENESTTLVNIDDINSDYEDEYGKPEVAGRCYEIDVKSILSAPQAYQEILSRLGESAFRATADYKEMREYTEMLKDNQNQSGDSLFDYFS